MFCRDSCESLTALFLLKANIMSNKTDLGTSGVVMGAIGKAVDIVGDIKAMRDRNVEKVRQERNDRFNRSISAKSFIAQQNWNNPTYRKSLFKQAGFNPVVMEGAANISAPSSAPQVANNPLDFSSVGGAISRTGQDMTNFGISLAQYGLEQSRLSYENTLKDAQIKSIVSEWCNNPTSFSNFVRNNGNAVLYTLPSGQSVTISDVDGNLLFVSDVAYPDFKDGEKFFEWTEKDGKFFSPLPFTLESFKNDLINVVNGYGKVFGYENVKSSTFSQNSSALLSLENLKRVTKDLSYYDKDKMIGYLQSFQSMSFVELQKKSLSLDNEFKDKYERTIKEYESNLAKHGLNSSDSLFVRLLSLGDSNVLSNLMQKAILNGKDAIVTLLSAYRDYKKKHSKSSEDYQNIDRLILDMYGVASSSGGNF